MLRINGLPWQLSLAEAPGRDAELQRAFVVIKTECQAEEGWQWIKESLSVSHHVRGFEGEPQRLGLHLRPFMLVNVLLREQNARKSPLYGGAAVSPDWM